MTPQIERAGLFASAVKNPAEPGTARLEERSGDPLDLDEMFDLVAIGPPWTAYLLYWWYWAWWTGVFSKEK